MEAAACRHAGRAAQRELGILKRRRAPPLPANPRVLRGLVLVTLPFAIVFPLLGGSLLAALGLDWLVVRLGVVSSRQQPT